jgi:nucleoside phosphorylase
MKILVTGSCQRGNTASFQQLCRDLGQQLAQQGHQIVLLSDDPRHADPCLAEGYLKVAARPSAPVLPPILVSYGTLEDPENKKGLKFRGLRKPANPNQFSDFNAQAQYPFNRVAVVRQVDAVVAIGGAEGAKQLIEIADALDIPMVPCAVFGGVAERLFEQRQLLLTQLGNIDLNCLSNNYAGSPDQRAAQMVSAAEAFVRTRSQARYQAHLALLTAVGVEFQQLLKVFPELVQQPAGGQYFVGNVAIGGRQTQIVACQQSQMGMPAAAAHAMNLIHEWRPRYLAMTGICAGIKGKTQLGDILVADPSWDYGSGKIVTGPAAKQRFLYAPYQERLDPALLSQVRALQGDQALRNGLQTEFFNQYKTQIGNQNPDYQIPVQAPALFVEPVASGSAVVQHPQIPRQIQADQHRRVHGIEMETYGMMYAASHCSGPKPTAISVKGVSDFATPGKGDSFQNYAAFVSALFVRKLLC